MYRLMRKKPYMEITITELCAEADLSRRTFYRHFQTPDQILEYSISEIAKEFLAKRDLVFARNRTFRTLTIMFFSFWEERLDLLFLFRKNHLYYYLNNVFSRHLKDLILHQASHAYSEEQIKTFLFLSGGLWQLMDDWLEDGAVKSPEEMGGFSDTIRSIM